jgi:hypothetical protein
MLEPSNGYKIKVVPESSSAKVNGTLFQKNKRIKSITPITAQNMA